MHHTPNYEHVKEDGKKEEELVHAQGAAVRLAVHRWRPFAWGASGMLRCTAQ